MPKFFDKILDSMKLSDDEDDLEFEDEMDDFEEEVKEPKKKNAKKAAKAESFEDEAEEYSYSKAAKAKRPSASVVPIREVGRKPQAELCMIKPTKMDDATEICDILLSGRAVIINLEGVHLDLAQKIIDFSSGACYAMQGNLQKITSSIIAATPKSIALSGDFQETLEGKVNLSSFGLDL